MLPYVIRLASSTRPLVLLLLLLFMIDAAAAQWMCVLPAAFPAPSPPPLSLLLLLLLLLLCCLLPMGSCSVLQALGLGISALRLFAVRLSSVIDVTRYAGLSSCNRSTRTGCDSC
jgi:hypothetical protein